MSPHTEEQKVEYKRLFAARKRNQIFVAIPLVALIVLFVAMEGKQTILGLPLRVAGPAFFVLVLGALAYSFYNWRCPACNKYLGKTISPKFCARCGVELH